MKEPDSIDNRADIIDSRQIIERIEWLASELERRYEEWLSDDEKRSRDALPFDAWLEVQCHDGDNEAVEYGHLLDLAEQGESSSDWRYGETLIRDSYFKSYAMEMADDCGLATRDQTSSWPFTCIDWDWAAKELAMDYFTVDFDGVDYFIRS